MGPCVESEKNAQFAYLTMRIRLCRTMKWIFAVKEEPDATGVTQTDITSRKTLRHKVFDCKVGKREKLKKNSSFREN